VIFSSSFLFLDDLSCIQIETVIETRKRSLAYDIFERDCVYGEKKAVLGWARVYGEEITDAGNKEWQEDKQRKL
jgi:hypothetical protein